MARARQLSSGRRLQKRNQCGLVGARGDRYLAGTGKRFGGLRRQAKMPHRERRSRNAGMPGAGGVILGAAPRKMQYGVDLAGLEGFDQSGWKRRGGGAIDNAHLGSDAARRQFTNEISSAILSGKIKQRGI